MSTRRIVALGLVLVLALASTGQGAAARPGQATSRLLLPVAPRSSLVASPVRFKTSLPGSGVSLTRPTASAAATGYAAADAIPPYLDQTDLEVSADGQQLIFRSTLAGPTSSIPPTGTFTIDFFGRWGDTPLGPGVVFDPFCASIETYRHVLFDNFWPNEAVVVRGNQVGGDEAVTFTGNYFANDQGAGDFLVAFGSGIPKSWILSATGQSSGLFATAPFASIPPGGTCSSQPPVFPPTSTWSSGPPFFVNETFDLQVFEVDGATGALIRVWNGSSWQSQGSIDTFTISGNTIEVRVSPSALGMPTPITANSSLTFGSLTSYFAPGATTGLGKPGLLDATRGPLGSIGLDQNQSALNQVGPIETWLGCGDGVSVGGKTSPPCSSSPQSTAARRAGAIQQPILLGVTGAQAPPGPLLGPIYVSRGGKVSQTPYGTYDREGIVLVFSTAPPLPGQAVQAETIPSCGSASAWAEVNGLSCASMQSYPANYVSNLVGALTADLQSARTLDSNGQYRSWISPTALGEASSGFYSLLSPNNGARMPLRYRGPYGQIGVTLPLARAPGGG